MTHKIRFSILAIILMMVCLAVSPVQAAPLRQNPTPEPGSVPVIGTIQKIEISVDPLTNTTTVLVTLLDDKGITSTIEITLDAAVTLGLVTLDTSGNPVIDETKVGTSVTIDPTTIVASGEETNKVANAIADLFATWFDVDAATIMGYHEDGIGFGVIAQAGFLSVAMDGDGAMLETILLAKQSGDYSAIVLPDGSTPANWGQFRKALLTSDKAKKNLGAIITERAEKGTGSPATGPEKNKPDKDNNGKKK